MFNDTYFIWISAGSLALVIIVLIVSLVSLHAMGRDIKRHMRDRYDY